MYILGSFTRERKEKQRVKINIKENPFFNVFKKKIFV